MLSADGSADVENLAIKIVGQLAHLSDIAVVGQVKERSNMQLPVSGVCKQ